MYILVGNWAGGDAAGEEGDAEATGGTEPAKRFVRRWAGTPEEHEASGTRRPVQAPPGGPNPAAFALYAWPGEAVAQDVSEQPFGIGTACFPTPLSKATPFAPPHTLVNNIGFPYLIGFPILSYVGPAPTYVFRNRTPKPGTWTMQGVIYDDASGGGKASLTNAVVLIQQ